MTRALSSSARFQNKVSQQQRTSQAVKSINKPFVVISVTLFCLVIAMKAQQLHGSKKDQNFPLMTHVLPMIRTALFSSSTALHLRSQYSSLSLSSCGNKAEIRLKYNKYVSSEGLIT